MAAPAGRGRGRGRGILGFNQVPSRPGGIPTQQTPVKDASNAPPNKMSQQKDQKPLSPNQKKPDQKLFSSNRNQPTITNGQSKPSTPLSNSPNSADISKLLEKVESMKKSEILSQLPSKIAELCKNNNGASIMNDFTKIICGKAIKDPEFATVAAQLCNACWIREQLNPLLRSPLLSAIQAEYKKRKELNREQFYGLTVLLCELYNVLKVQHQPLKPLNNPVCDLLKDLVKEDHVSEDDAFYFFQEMERVGRVIESDNRSNMDDIMTRVREICISDDQMLPSSKCRFVQLVELRAANWQLSQDTTAFYDDLSQDLMAKGQ